MIDFISIEQAEELDAFVEGHPRGHFMQSSLWGRVKSEWPWIGLILRNDSGRICGTMALLRHNLRHFPSCFFYAPRGPICDDLAAFSELVDVAAVYAKQQGSYLLRIDPEISEDDDSFAALVKEKGFHINQATDFSLFQPRLCYVSNLGGKDEPGLAASFRGSTRRNIRKAQESALSVRLGSVRDLDSFSLMMENTAAKNGFSPRQKTYFQNVLEGLGSAGRLYIAEHNSVPVAGAMTATFGKTCSFLYSCSAKEADKLHANELLQWHMQTDALRQGCTRFDFRGVIGYPDENNPHIGLHNYKHGFGAEFCSYIGQLDLPLRPWLYGVSSHFSFHTTTS